MRHTLRLSGIIVGHSDLEHAEPELGRARGAFRPGLGYDLIQPIFRLFAEAVPPNAEQRDQSKLERYYKARAALPLELQDANGERIDTTTIHIADYRSELGAEALELDVLIKDDAYWQRRNESE